MASERRRATPLNQPESEGQTSANPPASGEQDDMLRMLGEFETGLGSLKQLFIQRQALQSQLKAREDELAQRDMQLASKTSELETLMRQFEAQAHELDGSRADLAKREEELTKQRKTLEAAAKANQESHERDQAAVEQASKEINKQRAALEAQAQELARRAGELDERRKMLQAAGEKLDARSKELAAHAQQLEQERGEIERLRSDVSTREAQLAKAQAEFGDANARLNEMEQTLQRERERHAYASRQLSEEHTSALKQLDKQLQDAVASVKQWQSESQKWEKESTQNAQQAAAFEKHAASLEAQAAQQANRVSEFESKAAEFEKQAQYQQHVASDAAENFARVARRFDETSTELQQAREQLGNVTGELQAQMSVVAALQIRVDEKSHEVEHLSKLLDDVRTDNATQTHELGANAQTIEQQAKSLAALEQELAGVRSGSGTLEQKLHAATQELGQLREKFNIATKDAASSAKAAAQLREQNKQLEDHVGNLWQMISQEQASASDAADKWKSEIEANRKQYEESQAQLDASGRELAHALRDVERLKEEAATFVREREELSVRHAKEREQLIADLHAKLSEERLNWEKVAKNTLDSALTEARSQSQMGVHERVCELTEQLDRERDDKHSLVTNLRDVVEEYEQLWSIERGETVRLHEVTSRLSGETSEADQVVNMLRSKLKEEVEHRKSLREQLEDMNTRLEESAARISQLQSANVGVEPDAGKFQERGPRLHSGYSGWRSAESLARRDGRVRLMRRLVRDQVDKVRKGGEALRRRYEQTEQVLKQRAELSSARQRIIEAEQRLQSSKAKTKSGVLMLSAVATVAILGGLSWALAQQLAPSRFMATSMITADGRGRELNAKELSEWKTYHEKVLNDPRFHQIAGERYARVGMAELSSPAAVKQLIDTRLNADQRNPGEMVLTLTGYGSTRTERELDVLTVAFTSQANAAQTARVDGSVTKIAEAAKTGNEPLDNTRLYWALAMLGTGLVVCFGTALLLWKKLAGAKTKFEHDTQVAQLLDDAKWGTPEFLKETEVPKQKQNEQQRKAA